MRYRRSRIARSVKRFLHISSSCRNASPHGTSTSKKPDRISGGQESISFRSYALYSCFNATAHSNIAFFRQTCNEFSHAFGCCLHFGGETVAWTSQPPLRLVPADRFPYPALQIDCRVESESCPCFGSVAKPGWLKKLPHFLAVYCSRMAGHASPEVSGRAGCHHHPLRD